MEKKFDMDGEDGIYPLSGIDPDTIASLPGRIHGNVLRYSFYYPGYWVVLIGIFIFTQASGWYFASMASARLSTFFCISIIVAVFCIRIHWNHVKTMCYHGDLCAGRVISLNPVKVAVFTDLTISDVPYPAIKVIRFPRHFIFKKTIKVGDKIATVALYYRRNDEDGYWGDFDPKPVQCLTSDNQQIESALCRIPERLWNNLDKGIEQIKDKKNQVGLYFLEA